MHSGESRLPHRRAAAAGSTKRRRGAGTWEGAESSGVRAQGPVAHSRNELQAEDLLQEPGRPLAAAAALVLHPTAIHRREMRESAEVSLWLALTDNSAPGTSAASASPSAPALFLLPQRRCQVMVPSSNQSPPQMAEAGRELFPPPTLRMAHQDTAPTEYAPYWESLPFSSRAPSALPFSAAPPIR